MAHELAHVVQQSHRSEGTGTMAETQVRRWPPGSTPPATAGGSTRPRDLLRERRVPASSMGEYISLVRSLEAAYPELGPRQFLAMLRQIYYGRPWSASPTAQWMDVLPHSPAMSDPRERAGRHPGSLFHALRESQEVVGVDIGHVLTGLEAILDPIPRVSLTVTGPDPMVAMPNTEFATWGGDLGSAAGQAVADHLLDRTVRPDAEYFREYVSDADLEGNIDAFGIARGAAASGGLADLLSGTPPRSMAGTVRVGTPVSEILTRYYTGTASPLTRARADRFRDFAALVGGHVSGGRITNRSGLEGSMAERVASFARVWVVREMRDARGILSAAITHLLPPGGLDELLERRSRAMVNLMFDWLEARI